MVAVCGSCVWWLCVVAVCGSCVWWLCVVAVCGSCVWWLLTVLSCAACFCELPQKQAVHVETVQMFSDLLSRF